MFVQYAPYKLAEGNWDDIKETFADRCIEVLAEYAPNVPDGDRASAGAQRRSTWSGSTASPAATSCRAR